ncbi:MAG: hypothetical protein ACLP7Q_22740 [Isosphaeraceae bacterium]
MQTPQELARAAEQYDEEQWFEFLDELDAVSRRRQERCEEPTPADDGDRDSMARWIARKHLVSDSGIRQIWYLPHGSPPDEIRLLEVNDRLALSEAEAARVEPTEFGLAGKDSQLKLLVADVTGDQLDAIKAGHLKLPPGWELSGNIILNRRR